MASSMVARVAGVFPRVRGPRSRPEIEARGRLEGGGRRGRKPARRGRQHRDLHRLGHRPVTRREAGTGQHRVGAAEHLGPRPPVDATSGARSEPPASQSGRGPAGSGPRSPTGRTPSPGPRRRPRNPPPPARGGARMPSAPASGRPWRSSCAVSDRAGSSERGPTPTMRRTPRGRRRCGRLGAPCGTRRGSGDPLAMRPPVVGGRWDPPAAGGHPRPAGSRADPSSRDAADGDPIRQGAAAPVRGPPAETTIHGRGAPSAVAGSIARAWPLIMRATRPGGAHAP